MGLLEGLTKNTAELTEAADDSRLRPWWSDAPPGSVAASIRQWVEQHPRWNFVARQDSAGGVDIDLTHRTRLFRFVDDIHLRLTARPDGTRVDAESRSRVGVGDLGQNRRNLRELSASVPGAAGGS